MPKSKRMETLGTCFGATGHLMSAPNLEIKLDELGEHVSLAHALEKALATLQQLVFIAPDVGTSYYSYARLQRLGSIIFCVNNESDAKIIHIELQASIICRQFWNSVFIKYTAEFPDRDLLFAVVNFHDCGINLTQYLPLRNTHAVVAVD